MTAAVAMPVGAGISTGWVGNARDKVNDAASQVTSGLCKVNDAASRVVTDVDAMQKAVKFAAYATSAGELANGVTGASSHVKDSLGKVDGFVDATRLFVTSNFFLSGDWRAAHEEGRDSKVAALSILLVADTIGSALWLAEAGAVNLAKIGEKTGISRVFGSIANFSLSTFSLGLATVGLALLTADHITQAVKGTDVYGSVIGAISTASDVAMKTLSLAGQSIPAVHVSLGLIASGFGIWSFLHGEYGV